MKECVDLGLPSGLRWATCNVGAETPEDYGDYFAWGELTPKGTYNIDNSITHGVDIEDISGNPQYDAATAIWGEEWCIPTLEECEELVRECEWQWVEENGVNGYKVIGPNGDSIFLPAAGYRTGSLLSNVRQFGGYWSSTSNKGFDYCAYNFDFDNDNIDVFLSLRDYGQSIRPVKVL